MKKFLAGVGRALLFSGNNLIGVADTLTEDTFSFGVTAEEIRAGDGNALWAKYFHDSNLSISLIDAMFRLEYIAKTIGADVVYGGTSVKEEELTATAGVVSLTETPIAFDGALIGWYKKPSDDEWTMGAISGKTMTISGATVGQKYCVKYFYNNENARSIVIPSQFVPAELHVVIINDLYNGDVATSTNVSKIGHLITDIPRFQLDGGNELNLTATSAATVTISGMALAVAGSDGCETESYYGTMTEEIFGAKWQDDVVAIAVENSDMELSVNGTESAIVRVVYNNSPAQRKDNSNFTFTSSADGTASVDNQGVVNGVAAGTAYISVALTGYDVDPGVIEVTVNGGE